MRPLVEDLLFGYEPEFVGMLESEADGIGVWRCKDMTVVCNVNNQSFAPFLRLCNGEFGTKPTEADHLIVAVNCSFTTGNDIGQFWERSLKAQATELIDDRHWHDVYHLRPIRTAKGATGWLWASWGQAWRLYFSTDYEEAVECGKLIKVFESSQLHGVMLPPKRSEIIDALNEAYQEHCADNPKKMKLW